MHIILHLHLVLDSFTNFSIKAASGLHVLDESSHEVSKEMGLSSQHLSSDRFSSTST